MVKCIWILNGIAIWNSFPILDFFPFSNCFFDRMAANLLKNIQIFNGSDFKWLDYTLCYVSMNHTLPKLIERTRDKTFALNSCV